MSHGVKLGQVELGERLCEMLTKRKCKRFGDWFSERLEKCFIVRPWFEFGV